MANMHIDGSSKRVLEEMPSSIDPQGVQEDLTFLDLLIIVMQRKKLIGIVTALVTASAIAIAFLLPQEFTATVIILPPQGNSSMSSLLANQLAGMSAVSGMASSALGIKNINDMYVAMMKSRSVEEAVIKRYGLESEYHKHYLVDARKALEKHAQIDGSTKDGLIRLKFSDQSPDRASEIANGYVEQFRSLSQNLAITEASQRRVIFENQLEKTKADLENADEALKRTQLSTGMVQVDGQARALIDSAARLRAEVVSKQVQIEAMRSYAGDENPALTQAQSELEGLKAQFAKLVGSQGNGTDDLFVSKGNVPEAGLEYIRRLRDVKYYEAIFDVLARQLELAKLDEAKEGAFIQVVDPAVPPEQRSSPKRGLITIAGLAVGFTFGIMFALLQGGLVRMRHNPVTRYKLELLKQSLWQKPSPVPRKAPNAPDDVPPLHVRPEVTG